LKKIIAANLISGISLICLIIFGVKYIEFKNTPIYQNYKIEIVNNPITNDENIEFGMSGEKMLDCQATKVYGIAVNQAGTKEVILDQFASMYTRNVLKGKGVTNGWAFVKPKELTSGTWRVDMVAHWDCRLFIFTTSNTIRHHDNILLIVE